MRGVQKARPDWDLGAPGMREAWDRGDGSHFHAWQRDRRNALV